MSDNNKDFDAAVMTMLFDIEKKVLDITERVQNLEERNAIRSEVTGEFKIKQMPAQPIVAPETSSQRAKASKIVILAVGTFVVTVLGATFTGITKLVLSLIEVLK